MKNIYIILFSITSTFLIQQKLYSQTLNWNSLENTNHIISAGIGWDYSVSYNAGYACKFGKKAPIVLNTNFSIPAGEDFLDDFKSKIGAEVLLLNGNSLKGSITLNGIFRKYNNELVRLLNFGSEMKGSIGYYKSTWFIAGEVGFDKAIVTHFKHSDYFKDNIYSNVKDGWYEPATGGNFFFGVQTGYSCKIFDLTLDIGGITTQEFKTTPLIPFYATFGINYKVQKK